MMRMLLRLLFCGWILNMLGFFQTAKGATLIDVPSALEIASSPDVQMHETVKIFPPIISALPRLESLNRTVIMRPKSPNLPAVFYPPGLIARRTSPGPASDTGSHTKPTTDKAHVRSSRLPGVLNRPVPARFDHLPPLETDPSNFSTRITKQKDRIFRLTDKKSASLSKISKLSDVIRGIYWMLDSRIVRKSDANKRRFADAERWIKDVKTRRKVIRFEANGLYCGHNHLVTFDDGTLACTKQRRNYDQIQGEIFAYFLADLLEMRHYFPPTVLTKPGSSRLFATVMDAVHNSSTWDPAKPLIITKFLTHLKPIFLPKMLHSLLKFIANQTNNDSKEKAAFGQKNDGTKITVNPPIIDDKEAEQGINADTAITATKESNADGAEQGTEDTAAGTGTKEKITEEGLYDRMVADQQGNDEAVAKQPIIHDAPSGHSAPFVLPLISARSAELANCSDKELRELEQWSDLVVFDYLVGNLDRISNLAVNLQWHQQMLSLPVHNIYQSADDGQFIFMDNESGLFHGYRLLHQYDKYLQPLLRSFCIFNKSTVSAVKKLHHSRNAGATLMKMLEADYPRLINRLPGIGPKTSQILQKRLRYVYNHIRFCEDNYYLP